MKLKKYGIVYLVIAACVAMGIVDAAIRPEYMVKSAIKIGLFLIAPFVYAHFNKQCDLRSLFIPKKDGIKTAVLSGAVIYAVIIFAYVALKDIFDFSAVVTSLNDNVGVNKANFIWVALYISFVNSLLEEFFFRGFAFFALKEVSSRRFAYIFSSAAFALYHVSMMLGWFDMGLTALVIMGLFIGGAIFDMCNERSGNIYISWLIHMFANFAINTVGFMLLEVI